MVSWHQQFLRVAAFSIGGALAIACGEQVDVFDASSSGTGGQTTSTTGSGNGGAGGAFGQGGASSATAAGGSGGIYEPICPAPASCPAPGKGWNCDPACGAIEPWCNSAVCNDGTNVPVAELPMGNWELRLPPITAQHANCAAQCAPTGTWWGIRLTTPDGPQGLCVNWNAPDSGFAIHTENDLICPSDQFGTPICDAYSLAAISGFHLLVGIRAPGTGQLPDGGSRFTFYTYGVGCSNPPAPQGFCEGGCNGAGDTAAQP